MVSSIKFYLIDDERAILLTLEKIISKVFPEAEVLSFGEGIEAWTSLQKETSPCIIVSDLQMPGINGIQLLKKVRADEHLKDNYFMVITSNVEPEINMRTIQQGADDFLTKPFSVDQLVVKLRSAMRVLNSQLEVLKKRVDLMKLKESIQVESQKVHNLLVSLIDARYAHYKKSLNRIRESSVWIAKQLLESNEDIECVEKTAELCFIGRLCLNEVNMNFPVLINGLVQNQAMPATIDFADFTLSQLRGYENVQVLMRGIYENFDGSGIPAQKKSWEIPMGARIIRVAIEFEELSKKNPDNQAKCMEELYKEVKRLYDHTAVAYFDQYLGAKELGSPTKKGREFRARINELDLGMILSRHIITDSGLVLATAGTTLNEDKIERVRLINKSDPILGKIYIRQK